MLAPSRRRSEANCQRVPCLARTAPDMLTCRCNTAIITAVDGAWAGSFVAANGASVRAAGVRCLPVPLLSVVHEHVHLQWTGPRACRAISRIKRTRMSMVCGVKGCMQCTLMGRDDGDGMRPCTFCVRVCALTKAECSNASAARHSRSRRRISKGRIVLAFTGARSSQPPSRGLRLHRSRPGEEVVSVIRAER